MGAVESFLNLLLIFLIVGTVYNYFALARIKKAAQKMEEENASPPEVKKETVMVTDFICGRTLPQSEAYVLAGDNGKRYFCSWDCREKYITGNQDGCPPNQSC